MAQTSIEIPIPNTTSDPVVMVDVSSVAAANRTLMTNLAAGETVQIRVGASSDASESAALTTISGSADGRTVVSSYGSMYMGLKRTAGSSTDKKAFLMGDPSA